jgi:hypothetical protein
MGRLSVLREENVIREGRSSYIEWANNAVYGPAGELKNLSWVVHQGDTPMDSNVNDRILKEKCFPGP